jgi:hypothetical protein
MGILPVLDLVAGRMPSPQEKLLSYFIHYPKGLSHYSLHPQNNTTLHKSMMLMLLL